MGEGVVLKVQAESKKKEVLQMWTKQMWTKGHIRIESGPAEKRTNYDKRGRTVKTQNSFITLTPDPSQTKIHAPTYTHKLIHQGIHSP